MSDTKEAFFELIPHMVDIDVDEKGVIEYSDTRFEYFRTEMFAELFESMEEAAGPEIREDIARFGAKAGQNIAQRMDEEFKHTNLINILKLVFKSGFDIKAIKDIASTEDYAQWQKILGYGKYVGWFERIETQEFEEEEKYLRCRVYECFEAESHGETDERECIFLPGVCRGIAAYFWDMDPDKLIQFEESCASAGQDCCTMVIEEK